MIWDSSVGIATGYRLKSGGSIPIRGKKLVSVPGVKQPECDADHINLRYVGLVRIIWT
jgi:hypothetical protein